MFTAFLSDTKSEANAALHLQRKLRKVLLRSPNEFKWLVCVGHLSDDHIVVLLYGLSTPNLALGSSHFGRSGTRRRGRPRRHSPRGGGSIDIDIGPADGEAYATPTPMRRGGSTG